MQRPMIDIIREFIVSNSVAVPYPPVAESLLRETELKLGFALPETLALARQIAALSPVAVKLAKESVLKSFNSSLDEGLIFERKNFYLCFSSEDQKEGMKAFIEKRNPVFTGK